MSKQNYPYYGVSFGNVIPLENEEARLRFEKNGGKTFFSLAAAKDEASIQLQQFSGINPGSALTMAPVISVLNALVR